MQLFAVDQSAPGLNGATLIVPAVAFANIGELAVDALIATLQLRLAARLDDPNAQAVVGHDAFASAPGALVTALELYTPGADASTSGSAAPTFAVLQQRAPAIPGRQAAFAAALAKWAAAAGFSNVVVLAGLDARLRREEQLEGPQLRWHLQGSWREAAAACEAAGALPLEPQVEAVERELHGLLPPWCLLPVLAEAGVPALLLAQFASEGDNLADAVRLGACTLTALRALGVVVHVPRAVGATPAGVAEGLRQVAIEGGGDGDAEVTVVGPPSWVGLYGGTFDRSLF